MTSKVEQYKSYLTNLGRAGIRYTIYAHMSNIKGGLIPGFYQTSKGTTRGGAPTREFDLNVARKLLLRGHLGRGRHRDEQGRGPDDPALRAAEKIFKVHFRNVSSPLPKFRETFADEGTSICTR